MSPQTYEEEPQVGDYRRSVSSYDSNAEADHELTLSTPTILGLFFALAMVCACFFGLGYAMGHKTAPPTQVYSAPAVPVSGEAKPAPGSAVATQPAPAPDASAPVDGTSAVAQTATVPLTASAELTNTSAPTAAPSAPNPARPTPFAAVTAPPSASAAASGTFVVQVAAVSSQDVANILLSTL